MFSVTVTWAIWEFDMKCIFLRNVFCNVMHFFTVLKVTMLHHIVHISHKYHIHVRSWIGLNWMIYTWLPSGTKLSWLMSIARIYQGIHFRRVQFTEAHAEFIQSWIWYIDIDYRYSFLFNIQIATMEINYIWMSFVYTNFSVCNWTENSHAL